MSKYIRIQLDGNRSWLVYQRGLVHEFAAINSKQSYGSELRHAMRSLRASINYERLSARGTDVLAGKEPGTVLARHTARKRRAARALASECTHSKCPTNRAKHVGVEIEFVSSSDRSDIAMSLAMAGVAQFVELKGDGSVQGEPSSSDDCDGSCREDCTCAECGEEHYCDDQTECDRRHRNYGLRGDARWEIRDDCTECELEEVTETDGNGVETTVSLSACMGHCPGHSCLGYEDHNYYDCNCECNCSSSEESGHEIAIVAKSSLMPEIVRKVCHVLTNEHNASVNKTCGLHVHLDMRQTDPKRAFVHLVNAQDLLYSMVPKTRRNNQYCSPNQSLDMSGYQGRYYGINPKAYTEHKTLEVRLHSGSLNATKINNWITLLQKIAYRKSKTVKIRKLSDLVKAVQLSPDLVAYIAERIDTFSSDHGSASYRVQNDLKPMCTDPSVAA